MAILRKYKIRRGKMKRMGLIAASIILLIGVTGCSLFPTGESYSWGEKEAEVTVAEDGATFLKSC